MKKETRTQIVESENTIFKIKLETLILARALDSCSTELPPEPTNKQIEEAGDIILATAQRLREWYKQLGEVETLIELACRELPVDDEAVEAHCPCCGKPMNEVVLEREGCCEHCI